MAKTALFVSLAALAFAAFVALGIWQVQRRTWKLELIARVEARIHAPAGPAPGATEWPLITEAHDAYRHIQATGTFDNDAETLVQATTDLGGGFWVMTPLRATDGFMVLVNRGFVPTERREPATRAAGQSAGPVTITGLLRVSEPKGGFLRTNDPAANRWFSRDVEAIAAARGLGAVAPYFIDAEAMPNPGGLPIGGLTVVRFPNDHLAYAITWFTLALMVAGGTGYAVLGDWWPRRKRLPPPGFPGPGRQ